MNRTISSRLKTSVTELTISTNGNEDVAEIKLARNYPNGWAQPDVNDLPEDFQNALKAWLYDIKEGE